jgi:alanine racemase
VATLVGAIRTIAAGERFGGGGARTATRPTTVGVLPLGHSNSFLLRRPGQRAGVNGRTVEILSVSLEHAVVDLTDAGRVDEGTPVYLLARDAARGPALEDVARAQGRAGVEVLVALTDKSRYEHVS